MPVTTAQEDSPAMPVFEHSGISIEVDDDGFMASPDKWTPVIAEALAAGDGIAALTDDHWKIMTYIREYYAEFGVAPMVRKLCKDTGFPLKQMYELFPAGPAKGACKIAGLAKPTGCV